MQAMEDADRWVVVDGSGTEDEVAAAIWGIIEIRFPDPTANPYLAFAALMMAGLDGIEKKIHPGDPLDKDIYGLSPEELKEVPHVPHSLDAAMDALSGNTSQACLGSIVEALKGDKRETGLDTDTRRKSVDRHAAGPR